MLLPLAVAAALGSVWAGSGTELDPGAGAPAAARSDAGPEVTIPDSPRIVAMLQSHDDTQALLYGRSSPAAEFVVYANNVECARDTADAGGWWVVAVPGAAPCAPIAGNVLWIARDGEFLERAQMWNPGARSVGSGIDLDAPAGLAQDGLSPPQLAPLN